MISYIETAYDGGELSVDEDTTLLETIQETNQHTMKDHQTILEGVSDMVSQTLELKHKKIRQEAAAEAAKETELTMLMEMKTEGIPKQAIVRIAQRKNIPEEEVKRILDEQE